MSTTPADTRYRDLRPAAQSFRDAAVEGLGRSRKTIPSQFIYDDRGSQLFQQICELDEYYPTRTEIALLAACGAEIGRLMGPNCRIIEFGCGSSAKVRQILDQAETPASYIAIDISESALLALVDDLTAAYPDLPIIAICADYTAPLELPGTGDGRDVKNVGFFPGSNIGNFTPGEAEEYLRTTRAVLGAGGGFIIGVDLKKDKARLEAAYDDAKGITALFNLNLLERMNRELGADFDTKSFRHKAFYNEAEGRIEMHIESLGDQTVSVAGVKFEFAAGETIHSENSYKYSIREFQDLASRAGFDPVSVWSDGDDLFSVHYLTVA